MKGRVSKNQIISWILILALFFTSVSIESLTVQATEITESEQTSETTTDDADETDEEDQADEIPVTEEDAILDENTPTSTTFDVGDGKKMTVFYQEPVRFENEEGELVDYDPSLTEVDEKETDNNVSLDGYVYENAEGDKKQYFPEILSEDTPILMENQEYSIKMNPTEETKKVTVEEDEYTNGYEETKDVPLKAVYESEETDASYSYTSSESGIKEEIILPEVPESNVFTYELRLNGMTARKNATDEGITLYDEEKDEIVGNIAAPNMNDASMEAYSEALTCELVEDETEEGLYHISITADWDYLNDDERQYPVIIDPTATWVTDTNFRDVYVLNGTNYKDMNFYDSGVVAFACGKGSKGVYRTYLGFINLKTAIEGRYIESATLKLRETANSGSGQTVQAYRVKTSWNRSTLTWNNKPSCETVYATVKSTGTYKAVRNLNLTNFVRKLARDEINNYGIMLKGQNETGNYCEFVGSRHSSSSLRPRLTVVHYNKPTIPDSVSINTQYLKEGNKLTVSWTGIESKALAYTQYKLCSRDQETNENIAIVKDYSSETKMKAASSGTVTIADSANWEEGVWRIYVRGVDKGGMAGTGQGVRFVIDGTAPTLNKPVISPTTSEASPSNNATPTITWSGASDEYFKNVQYKIDDGSFVKMGTTASGTFVIPANKIKANGRHTIRVRAVDMAGNVKSYTLYYYFHKTWSGFTGYLPEDDSLTISKLYGKTIITWETENELDDNTFYRIYRGTTANFTVNDSSRICDKVKSSYWIDTSNLANAILI